ncbi:MAG: hypothetical protein DDT26_01842 [Dehalococcoidia bacterium]|nr:hypothetical protein [Chloroflexota bacterium]
MLNVTRIIFDLDELTFEHYNDREDEYRLAFFKRIDLLDALRNLVERRSRVYINLWASSEEIHQRSNCLIEEAQGDALVNTPIGVFAFPLKSVLNWLGTAAESGRDWLPDASKISA